MGAGHEQSAVSENNLTMSAGTGAPVGASFAESAASASTTPSITDDYSGNSRGSTPDIGALQFNGTGTDVTGPTISYTAVPASACSPSIVATITDPSGINTNSGTKPRLWFKRSGDATQTVATANNNTASGWKYVEASNNNSPFSFNFDYSLLDAAPVAGTDNIQ